MVNLKPCATRKLINCYTNQYVGTPVTPKSKSYDEGDLKEKVICITLYAVAVEGTANT